jgi:hypothetical protein
MRVLIFILCFTLVNARVVRYGELKCEWKEDYKICDVERHGDYIVHGYKGKTSIFCEYDKQLFFYKNEAYALSAGNKLYVPTIHWNIAKWTEFLDKLTI